MCDHNTTVTMFLKEYLTIEICTWGCGKILICEVGKNGTTQTLREIEHPELAAKDARIAKLEAALKNIANMKNYKLKNGETVQEAYYICHSMAWHALQDSE